MEKHPSDDHSVRLFLCGDVMTGRGVDQVLPHPGDPTLYEPAIRDAREYVALAETANGPVNRPVDFDYVWGEALGLLEAVKPAARIINLETAVTDHPEPWPGKGINYRMHPQNAPVLDAIQTDCCVLANNHVLDWHAPGLVQTLDTLHGRAIATAGAGRDADEAKRPAVLALGEGRRLLVFAFALPSSGVSAEWAATDERPGVGFLPDLSGRSLAHVARIIAEHHRRGDLVMVSLHWGGNWGYDISPGERHFAHGLIEEADADLVHGHSSHHPRGMEIHRGRLILYGCGDCLNDYEGIGGHEPFRPELAALYLPRLAPDGTLLRLDLAPMRIERMRLNRANREQAAWLTDAFNEHAPDDSARLALATEPPGSAEHPMLSLTP